MQRRKGPLKDLAQIIRENPGCTFTVDNDCWWCLPAPPKPVHEMTQAERDEWDLAPHLARDGEVTPKGDGGYGSGALYGGDILQALAEIVGVKIESV